MTMEFPRAQAWIRAGLKLAGIALGCLPPVAAQTAPAIDPKLPTVFVIGDSTANNNDHRGWADPFAAYFDLGRVNIVNRARGGRSSRTFVTEGLWEATRHDLKPGDYVPIQFGHNDGSAPDEGRACGARRSPTRPAPSPPGTRRWARRK
jgi:lysophospholipase L1-like esterase